MAAAPDNKFERPTPAGYRDTSFSMKAPDGQVAELQINTKAMIAAKELKGHTWYEEYRELNEGIKAGEVPDTPENRNRIGELEKLQTDLYADAWSKSQ